MKNRLKAKIGDIVDGKLTETETEELIDFFKYALIESFDQDDENFFKGLAYEMSGSVKDLALMIIDFRRDLKSRIQPGITDLTENYIPETANQLEGIIETTEQAAHKIMDNLEAMESGSESMAAMLSDLKSGKISLPASNGTAYEAQLCGPANSLSFSATAWASSVSDISGLRTFSATLIPNDTTIFCSLDSI